MGQNCGELQFKIKFAAFIVVLYVALCYLTGLLAGENLPVALASLLFLPAFARLLGFLVIGYWSIPALFIAELFCIDLGLGLSDRVLVSAFTATGAPLAIATASRLLQLQPGLANLTAIRLLWLSLASSFGNMIFYSTSLTLAGLEFFHPQVLAATFIGDTLGTWAIIYVIKLGMTFWSRWVQNR